PHPMSSSLSATLPPPLLHLPSPVLSTSTSTPACPCWSAWKDAPAPAPSYSSPSLAPPALRPPSIVLDSCTSTPGWPCWSACLDAPGRAFPFALLELVEGTFARQTDCPSNPMPPRGCRTL